MLNEEEKKELTVIIKSAVESAMQENDGCAIGLNPDDVAELKDFARALRIIKKKAVSTFVYLIIVGICGVFILGLKAYFQK